MLDVFLFADDITKRALTEENVRKVVGQLSDSCDSYDLTIGIKRLRWYINQHLESLTMIHRYSES